MFVIYSFVVYLYLSWTTRCYAECGAECGFCSTHIFNAMFPSSCTSSSDGDIRNVSGMCGGWSRVHAGAAETGSDQLLSGEGTEGCGEKTYFGGHERWVSSCTAEGTQKYTRVKRQYANRVIQYRSKNIWTLTVIGFRSHDLLGHCKIYHFIALKKMLGSFYSMIWVIIHSFPYTL